MFKLTLDENRQKDIHGQRLTFIPSVRSELQDQNRGLRIDTSVLDQALLEAASSQPNGKPLDYLLPCWKRVSRLHKGFRKARADDPKFEVICEARRLCMSYSVFALTMPEMFGWVISSGPNHRSEDMVTDYAAIVLIHRNGRLSNPISF